MSIRVEYLEELENRVDNSLSKTIRILLSSINDWPTPIFTINEFRNEISIIVGEIISRETIKNCITNLDFKTDAWKIESLTGLLELFEFSNTYKSFDDVISELNQI